MTGHVRQRVVFVTGKGGVGKTTVAAALAHRAAARDGRAILLEIEDGRAAERALTGSPRVELVTLTFADALVGAIGRLLGSRLLGRALVKQRSMARLLDTVPAVRELVVLDEVRTLAANDPEATVVVDLPATGHAVDFLRVPLAGARFLRVGPAARMCEAILDELVLSPSTDIVVVGTAEPVVARETLELCQRLLSGLGRSPALIVQNRVPRVPTQAELDAAHLHAAADPALLPLLELLAERKQLALLAARAREELQLASGATLRVVADFIVDPSAAQIAEALA
ncbi:MAG: hypothetical protein KF718_17680 [Polyangiaceae bacterium]|nr:hypothetical protein [Polyangiaceae bacterium]